MAGWTVSQNPSTHLIKTIWTTLAVISVLLCWLPISTTTIGQKECKKHTTNHAKDLRQAFFRNRNNNCHMLLHFMVYHCYRWGVNNNDDNEIIVSRNSRLGISIHYLFLLLTLIYGRPKYTGHNFFLFHGCPWPILYVSFLFPRSL